MNPRELFRVAIVSLTAIVPIWADAEDSAEQLAGVAMPSSQDQNNATASSADGTVRLPATDLPLSNFRSPQARQEIIESLEHPYPTPKGSIDVPGPIVDAWRREFDTKIFPPRIKALRAQYPVTVERRTVAGVYTEVIASKDGVLPRNDNRILINLHGGGFVMGARQGAQAEAIPVASVARIKVMTVDYRLAPEHKFPAASEDVAAVYRELLESYKPENIGIFGSSAGGLLTAQAVAWFQKEKLPRPGAIGMLCASAAGQWDGDSEHLWLPGAGEGGVDRVDPYLKDAELSDPLVAPFWSTEVLAKFPATLIMTSTRAFDLSSAVETDLRLTKVGVESELHVWDGLGHCMFSNAGTPEAADATAILAKFFDRHLGRE